MRTWKIYKHTLLIGPHKGWSYIGQTCKRWVNERWRNGNGYMRNAFFYNEIKKYGWENFDHQIIEDNIYSIEKANEREIYWINYYHTWVGDENCKGFNLDSGGSRTGGKHSEETKKKISNALLGHKVSQETLSKMSKSLKGKSSWAKGKLSWNHGLTKETNESLRKASERMKGFKHTEETKNKLKATAQKRKDDYYNYLNKKVLCVETDIIYDSLKEAAKAVGLKAATSISACLVGKTNTAAGYHWAYADDYKKIQLLSVYKNKAKVIHNGHSCRKIYCVELNIVFESIKSAAEYLNITAGSIRNCLTKHNSKYTGGGYHWEYVK